MVSRKFSITLSDVSVRRRGRDILGPISLTMPEDGFTIVLGPNGAGKTTLLRVLHGVERISAGQVAWSIPEDEARLAQAYVFQHPIMLRRSVRQNLSYPLALADTPKAEITRKVEDWAARIGLSDALNDPAPRLSGGEKQKLALARALIGSPRFLFLDEPCANLDGRATREIETMLCKANETGTRIIMTTHDLGQARRLAHDVVFLLKGAIHEQGPSRQIFDRPATAETKAFFQGDILE